MNGFFSIDKRNGVRVPAAKARSVQRPRHAAITPSKVAGTSAAPASVKPAADSALATPKPSVNVQQPVPDELASKSVISDRTIEPDIVRGTSEVAALQSLTIVVRELVEQLNQMRPLLALLSEGRSNRRWLRREGKARLTKEEVGKPSMTIIEVAELLGVGRSTVYKLRDEPGFPKPLRISARSVRFDAEEIAKWRAGRGAQKAVTSAAQTGNCGSATEHR